MCKKSVRPHRRCQCGSKKKYRNCCGKEKKVFFNDLPLDTQEALKKLIQKPKIASKYHFDHLGHTPEIVSTIYQGKRIVALGGKLICSDNPKFDWPELAQFFHSHLKTVLGIEWFDNELKKSTEDRHIIVTWAIDGKYEILDPAQPIASRKFNGSSLAYLHFAYDLFVLNNQNHITKKLISRLKSKQNFNGARYELLVLATLIRAGFVIQPYDETLGVGKVTECKAIYKDTNIVIEIEAKTRNVKDVMGASEGNQNKIKIYDKLRNAIEKNVSHPYIIFVDLNLPEFNVCNMNQKIVKVREQINKFIQDHIENLPNAIICTNIPFHYAEKNQDPSESVCGIIKVHNPKFYLKDEDLILNEIQLAFEKYKYLPWEFSESENYANHLIK